MLCCAGSRLKLFQPQDMPVVVTSYEIVIADIKYLAKVCTAVVVFYALPSLQSKW
jgi:hypothetical protein